MTAYQSILVTGGRGMLAHDLLQQLRLRGHAPVAVDRQTCDVTRPADLEALFEKHRPTLLLNCAAYTAVDLAEDQPDMADAINGHALATLAQLCCKYETKLVHFSTDFVFDGESNRPYLPEDRPNPLSVYGLSKLKGEANVIHIAPPHWLIIRTSWLFGLNGECFPQTMLKFAKAGRKLRMVADQVGCPTYSVDLAEATLRLVDANVSGVLHVTNAGPTSWHDFAAQTLRQFETPADLEAVSTRQWVSLRPKQAKRPAYSVLDGSAYQDATGWEMRPWHQALHAYCIAVRKAGEIS